MNKIFKHIALFCLLAQSVALGADTHELSLWAAIDFTKRWDNGLYINARADYRARDMIRTTNLFFVRAMLGYQPVKYVSMAVGYDNLSTHVLSKVQQGVTLPDYYNNANRLLGDVMGKCDFGNFKLTLRERYIYSYRMPRTVTGTDELGSASVVNFDAVQSHELRSRLKLQYQINNVPLKPYVADELINSLLIGEHFHVNYNRAFVGLNVQCNKSNSFNFYYCCQSKFSENTLHYHTIGIDYIVSL